MPVALELRYSSSGTTAGTDDYDDWNDTSTATDVHRQYVWVTTASTSTADYQPTHLHDYEIEIGRGRNDRKKRIPSTKSFTKFVDRIRGIDDERRNRARTYRSVPPKKPKPRGVHAAKRRR